MSRFQVTTRYCPDLVGACQQECRYPTTCGEAGECRRDDDKATCPHYDLPRVDGAGCPDCNFEEDVEAVIACLGDDAALIKEEAYRYTPEHGAIVCGEWADTMDKAAKHLQFFLDCRRLSYPADDEFTAARLLDEREHPETLPCGNCTGSVCHCIGGQG